MHKEFLTPLLILLVCSIFCLIQAESVSAQSLEWFRTYGTSYNEWDDQRGYWVEQTFDSGYIIAGADYPYPYLIKTTPSHDGDTLLWTWTDSTMYSAQCVQQTRDSAYIVVTLNSLFKINSSGDSIYWKKPYGGYCVRQTFDGGYITAAGGGTLIKTDSMGDTMGDAGWIHTYSCGERGWVGSQSVQQTTDSGYIIVGTSYVWAYPYHDTMNVCIIKTDSIGDTLWTRTYGETHLVDYAFSVQQTFDRGYIVAGNAGNKVYLIKTDSAGDSQWSRTYGWGTINEARSVQQTYDSGYIVCGYSNLLHTGEMDLYLIKTNSGGDTVWTRFFGGIWEAYGNCVQQTLDSGYIAVGYLDTYDPRDDDVYLIKVAPYQRGDANRNGCINMVDVVYLINYLFVNGPPPNPLAAGDANHNGIVNIADVVYLINYLFVGGPPP